MASFEQEFYLENPTRWQSLKRDLRLLAWLARPALDWMTRGVRVRRAYRRARQTGTQLVLEDVVHSPED